MSFKKSNDELRNSIQELSREELCLAALLYLEYRIRFYKISKETAARQYRNCASIFYENLQTHMLFRDEFFGMADFSYRLTRAAKRRNWQSLECVIDSLSDGVQMGSMVYTERTALVNIVKSVLEQYYELPMAKILKAARA